jgi:hypothetical protein
LFDGLVEGERRQLEGNAQNIDNQQPSTSALCQELSNVITIDDDDEVIVGEEDEMRQKTNSRISNGSNNDVCLLTTI